MTDILDQTINKINEISEATTRKVGVFFKKTVNKGEEYAVKGKIKIEIKKLEWDLNQLYIKLGEYVSIKNRKAGVMDFSHDDQYISLLEKIESQRQYISGRYKDMATDKKIKNDDESI